MRVLNVHIDMRWHKVAASFIIIIIHGTDMNFILHIVFIYLFIVLPRNRYTGVIHGYRNSQVISNLCLCNSLSLKCSPG